ncbi:hypothetical protein O181_006001 [Austropuccinia psidii MF-1]|uniref:Uncharacterized protein n=1 Tax=Austropuccinia psidii MF-1 TaxID=1389203 RepID=A0A9Q3GGD4_9BASI|nr:hypothetical protein [Austropuccinia psidii MF-1]
MATADVLGRHVQSRETKVSEDVTSKQHSTFGVLIRSASFKNSREYIFFGASICGENDFNCEHTLATSFEDIQQIICMNHLEKLDEFSNALVSKTPTRGAVLRGSARPIRSSGGFFRNKQRKKDFKLKSFIEYFHIFELLYLQNILPAFPQK